MEAVMDKIEIEKYPAYKDSGVDWLGKIPNHWETKPGFTVVEERKEKNIGLKEKTVLSLSYGNVIVKPEEKLTGLVPESFETYQLVYPGDIIIRPTDLQNDKTSLRTGLAKNKGIITSAYINLKVKETHNCNFFHYFLHTIDLNKVIYGSGSGLRQNLDYGDFKRFRFLCPPIEEQAAIASFLDRKTAQIDKTIAQKEKLIELLKERRQILIHKAVTRGLDRNTKMKDSGVEWIGEIAEHWEVKKLKYLVDVKGGFAFDSTNFKDEGVQLIRIANTYMNELCLDRQPAFLDYKFLETHRDWVVSKGDILISLTGTLGKRDYGFAIQIENENKYLLNQRVAKISTKGTIKAEYILNILRSEMFLGPLFMLPAGTKQANLSNDNILNIKVAIPSNPLERNLILEFIKDMKRRIAEAITNKEQEIEMLKEYKSTLINAAATGKIKVC